MSGGGQYNYGKRKGLGRGQHDGTDSGQFDQNGSGDGEGDPPPRYSHGISFEQPEDPYKDDIYDPPFRKKNT